MKRVFAIILSMLTLVTLSSCGNSYNGKYVQLDMTTIEKELKENSALAKETYVGTYVEVKGKLAAINSYSSITVHMPDEDAISGRRVIVCKVKNKKAKEEIKNMSVDDTVTVKGKITKIGGLWDCHLDVYEID